MDRLRKTYYRLPREVRALLTPAVDAMLRTGALPFLQRETEAGRLERRLWGGFSRSAAADLRVLADNRARPREAAEALRALARWEGTEGATEAALALIGEARARDPRVAYDRRHYLLEALMLSWAGRGEEARALIAARTEGKPFFSSAALILANSWAPEACGEGEAPEAAEAARLAAINTVFAHFGVSGIVKRDPGRPLGFDNVAGAPCPPARPNAKVTVIVPLYNAEATLPTALDGLAAQSWHDLEVLIVDDASTDRSADVAAAYGERDDRFRLLRQAENGGSYVARNRALAAATGSFVTVHDADDWSHPEKIRLHVEAQRARARRPFTLSDWVRADERLGFRGPWRPSHALVLRNFSSFFAPRELLLRVGGWDPVRVAADSELIFRLERLYRTGRTPPLLPGCPLAFGRVAAGQLTGSGATRLATLYHGVRREYHEARTLWHLGLVGTGVRAGGTLPPPSLEPVPPGIRPARRARPAADLLLVASMNRRAGWKPAALPLLEALRAAGLTPALLHYPEYGADVIRPLNLEIRRFAAEAGMAVIAPGERLEASVVLVRDPDVFAHPMDRFPEIAHRQLIVAPAGRRAGKAARTGLAAAFGGCAGVWRTGAEARPAALAAWLAGLPRGGPA